MESSTNQSGVIQRGWPTSHELAAQHDPVNIARTQDVPYPNVSADALALEIPSHYNYVPGFGRATHGTPLFDLPLGTTFNVANADDYRDWSMYGPPVYHESFVMLPQLGGSYDGFQGYEAIQPGMDPWSGNYTQIMGCSSTPTHTDTGGSDSVVHDPFLAETSRPRFQCNFPGCLRTFSRGTDLDRHHTSVHEGRGVQCPNCGKGLSRQDKVKKHMESKACAGRTSSSASRASRG